MGPRRLQPRRRRAQPRPLGAHSQDRWGARRLQPRWRRAQPRPLEAPPLAATSAAHSQDPWGPRRLQPQRGRRAEGRAAPPPTGHTSFTARPKPAVPFLAPCGVPAVAPATSWNAFLFLSALSWRLFCSFLSSWRAFDKFLCHFGGPGPIKNHDFL